MLLGERGGGDGLGQSGGVGGEPGLGGGGWSGAGWFGGGGGADGGNGRPGGAEGGEGAAGGALGWPSIAFAKMSRSSSVEPAAASPGATGGRGGDVREQRRGRRWQARR